MATRRFTRHDASSHTRYQELKQLARSQRRVLAGTPGTLKQRSRRGTDYWVREYIRVDGKKDDEHIGTVASIDGARIKDLQAEIGLAKALASGSSTLRLLGFQRIERKAAAVLAAFCNNGLYRGGLVLVGSHAYGCDICQDVCPWNRKAAATDDAPWQPRPGLDGPRLLDLWNRSDDDLRTLLKGSPMKRAGIRRLRRNLAVSIGNSGDPSAARDLSAATEETCRDPLVAEHVAWAVDKLDG